MRPRTRGQLDDAERLQAIATSPQHTPRAIRDWIRQHYVSAAVTRLYEIGMGLTRFEVPTAVGSIVNVPASANVQRAALAEVLTYGLPRQVGLSDDEGNSVPGVIALPALEMTATQRMVHGGEDMAENETADEVDSAAEREAEAVVDAERPRKPAGKRAGKPAGKRGKK